MITQTDNMNWSTLCGLGTSLTTRVRNVLQVISVIFVALGLAGCQESLFSNLNESEANEIYAVLEQNRIFATRKTIADDLYAINVEKNKIGQAIRVLSNHGLPRKKYSSLGDLFSDESVVKTPFEQQVRFIHGTSQEISASLSQVRGVVTARVHIKLPGQIKKFDQPQKSGASVLILHHPDVSLTDKVPEIKLFVANAVSDLTYENVSVTLLPSGQMYQQSPILVKTPEIFAERDQYRKSTSLDSSKPEMLSSDKPQLFLGSFVPTLEDARTFGLMILAFSFVFFAYGALRFFRRSS